MEVLKKGTKDFFMSASYLVDAYYENRRCLTLKELKELSGIHSSAIFSLLVSNGILYSLKGQKHSGYIFSKDPKEIMVLDIIRALQGVPYALCSSHSYLSSGKECPICEVINKGIKLMTDTLLNMSIYEYVVSLREVENSDCKNDMCNSLK